MFVLIPSVIQNTCCISVVSGPFPDMLYQHVCDLTGRCRWSMSYIIGCVVQAIIEERDRGELVCVLYVGVTKQAAVKVCEERRL